MSRSKNNQEILRLQKEIQQLRSMNQYFQNNNVNNVQNTNNYSQNQTDRYYYKPNSYIKKFIYKTAQQSRENSPNRENTDNNNYNNISRSSNQTRKNSKEFVGNYLNDFQNVKRKNTGSIVLGIKPPVKKGIFSYLPGMNSSFTGGAEYNKQCPSSFIANQIKNNNPNSSMISLDLQLHFWDEEEMSKIRSQEGNNKPLTSSLNLNKYKIKDFSNIKTNKSSSNLQDNNNNKQYTGPNVSRVANQNNNYTVNKISPILSQNASKGHFILSPNELQYDSDKNNTSTTIVKIIENNYSFSKKPKYEKESRRLCVEYIKVLKTFRYNIYKTLDNILYSYGISSKVLNQEKKYEIVQEQKSKEENIKDEEPYKKTGNFNNKLNDNSNNSFYQNISNSNKFIDSKYLYQTPQIFANQLQIEKKKKDLSSLQEVSKFLDEMNDETKDKLKMINFLSVPRKMDLILSRASQITSKKFIKILSLIFVLTPNTMSYQHGIESYIFKFYDPNKKKYLGGFDLIKLKSCTIIPDNPSHFNIETNDGKKTRVYEIDTASLELCAKYVKSFNYLNQIVKCKLFKYYSNNKSNYDSNRYNIDYIK